MTVNRKIFFNIWTKPSELIQAKPKEGERSWDGIHYHLLGWLNYALMTILCPSVFYDQIQHMAIPSAKVS